MRVAAIALMLTVMPSLAQATDLQTFRVVVGAQGESVLVHEVAQKLSSPGEDKEAFLLRTAPWLRNYTAGSGHEACASICRAPDGRTGLILSTSGSQVACAITSRCPDGFAVTKESIHSHPITRLNDDGKHVATKGVRMNASDVAFARSAGNRRARRNEAVGADPRDFSQQDIAMGAGYLVVNDQLLYQDVKTGGSQTRRTVGSLPPQE